MRFGNSARMLVRSRTRRPRRMRWVTKNSDD
jgi:hypothetical protein